MKELGIEEQKSIVGGYSFTDLTTGYGYNYTDKNKIKSIWYDLKSQGHKVTKIIG
ncbi:hypothetical protein HYH39_16140 [Clostridium botulinum]|uniref:hypothetical protein n=1 Tax=unclassified Clostridium TaxID=2614128 RepID=UPI000AC6DFA0|nr:MULTISPECIES: hypothetical protein [unclassified Clostridium]MBY6780412.1 hypothetical protein [Clostridium botulinum]MBY6853639.1 hypothetical protein [Clostridium botulinum]MBY7009211.1 hypothetical protein [Clostridium botulinum]